MSRTTANRRRESDPLASVIPAPITRGSEGSDEGRDPCQLPLVLGVVIAPALTLRVHTLAWIPACPLAPLGAGMTILVGFREARSAAGCEIIFPLAPATTA